MAALIKKKLELKIILSVTVVVACMVGIFAYVDIRSMRQDTIHTSERTLGAFAAAIKGSVIGSMKRGHHEDVRQVLKEVNTPFFINRVMIYDETGRPLLGMENFYPQGLDMELPSGIAKSVLDGDISHITEQGDAHFISYTLPSKTSRNVFVATGERPG